MLETLLLGLLRHPASGYDLRGDFESGPWPAELSQVYPTLRRMEARGWLVSESQRSRRGPARRVYRLTDAGGAELAQRLADGPPVTPERVSWLVQMRFVGHLEPAEARAWLERLARLLADEFHTAREHERRWTDVPQDDAGFFERSAAACAVAVADARLHWCEDTLRALDQRPPPEPGSE